MKTFLSFALMLASLSSFAATYEGEGKQTEFGSETCSMSVTDIGGSNVVIKMLALNQEVTTIVADGDETNFEVLLTSNAKSAVNGKNVKGSLSVKASGKLKNSKPVSYRLEITSNDALMGNDKESINCKF